MLIKKILMTVAWVIPAFCFAVDIEQATKDRMKSDLDSIRNVLDVGYAPREWKNTYCGWDLDAEIQNAKNCIQNVQGITVKKYQKIVSDFFHSTKDYHVDVYFYSTESAKLPFTVKTAEGRYFISYVDSSKLNSLVYPLYEGDELVLFDNRPIADVMKELIDNNSNHANESTDRMMASFFLTHRSGALGQYVPRGSVTVGVKTGESNEIKTMQMMWSYEPEKISNGFLGSIDNEKTKGSSIFSSRKFHEPIMVMPQYEFLKPFFAHDGEEQDQFIGSRKSYLPTLGIRLWWVSPSNSFFHAYIYETMDHKLVGYVRIPHYAGGSFHVEEFAEIMGLFEERTDALVIDQVDNPGGSLFFMYGLLSTLTNQPLQVPKHRMMINQEMVYDAFESIEELKRIKSDQDAQEMLGMDIDGIPITYQFVQFYIEYLNFIISEWDSGRKLTEPYHIMAIENILPHPAYRYTKPILLLTNSLDISCGDFFPAILQDNKRVTILGSRTAGAGGYVLGTTFPNRFGVIGFSYTGSIAERLNKQPIENLGVTPDIEYETTVEDIQCNYQRYMQAIDHTIYNMLTPKITPPDVEEKVSDSDEAKETKKEEVATDKSKKTKKVQPKKKKKVPTKQ